MLVRKALYLVYSLPIPWQQPPWTPLPCQMSWFTEALIADFFHDDPSRSAAFRSMLAKNSVGLVWHQEGQWLSYAWMSKPGASPPPHLPRNVRLNDFYWIYYCRTRPHAQGRGLFRRSLAALAASARKEAPTASVYVDTAPANIPSRRAIAAAGFVPAGVIRAWRVRLPKLASFVLGFWSANEAHSP